MAPLDRQARLFPDEKARDDAIVINGRCLLRADGDQRLVLVGGLPVACFDAGDRAAEAYAMVLLVEQGYAQQIEVARAFGCSERSVRRFQRNYEDGGLVALLRVPGYPKGRPRERGRDRRVGTLKEAGHSNREIAHRLGVTEKAVRKRLRRLGWKPPPPPAQLALTTVKGADPNLSGPTPTPVSDPPDPRVKDADPNLSGPTPALVGEESEEIPFTSDTDPADRKLDRFFAFLGLLDDAAPLFRDGTAVPGAGVLLAVPDLVATGVLAAAKQVWGSIGPAFYGLRTTVMAMLLMALLRVQRPEGLKERSPLDFGRVLGLDRAPEVKTVRRKLTRFAALGGVETFGRLLAQRRVATHGHALGFLYIDGHVRIYYGKRRIPKAHAARINAVAPATTDYWVNDQAGDPLLVVTARANAATTTMLPPLLAEIRKLVGERRVTVVFDRGGYSPELWAKILKDGFDILTYRKGKWRNLPAKCFSKQSAKLDGRKVTYHLADHEVRIGKLRLRQVTRRQEGHQTPVLTSRRDLRAVEVAHRMFSRWRQENFFKYQREEYLIDALVDYKAEPDDPMREVPNPKWAAADADLRAARAEIDRLQRAAFLGNVRDAIGDDPAPRSDPPRGAAVWAAIQRAITLLKRRDRIPRRIPIGKTTDEPIIKLATQRKHLSNLIKMVAYQAESALTNAVAPHYKRAAEEGRTLVQSALASAADITVTKTELLVTLAPLSSPHRSRAVAALCDKLNATRTVFPGTRLRLRYAVAGVATGAPMAP
ncbi:MAG: putative transposase [Gemmatimonadales bacterium]